MFILLTDTLSPRLLIQRISEGDHPIGIIIHPQDSAITLMIDPTLHEAYKKSLITAAMFILKGAESKVAMQKLLSVYQPFLPLMNTDSLLQGLPPVREQFAVKEKSSIKPTPVQNNIPGFILFAMFFIVIPLSGSIINERTEGAFFRLQALPSSIPATLSAKVLLYLGICIIQFLFMWLVGVYVLHGIFGFPLLEIGKNYFALALATISASLAAIGFGILVGTCSQNHNQAALFGSVLVVILGIISGTFLPIHVMPQAIRVISSLSPIRWGIDNYLDLFIRDGNIGTILPGMIRLLLFFIFAMMVSIFIFAKRKK